MPIQKRPITTSLTPAPMNQRRQGFLRVLLAVLAIGGGAVGIPFFLGGVAALIGGKDNGVTLIVLGAAIVIAAIVVPRMVIRRWGAAMTAVHHPAVALPFGARQRGSGVTLRPRAAIRVTPGLLVPMMLLTVTGMHLDAVNPIAVWTVAGLTVVVFVGWLWLRRYELCMDSAGVWRRRRPRWRLAWQDLERTETMATPKGANQMRPDDLVLHGLVARPGGKVTRTVRIRMNLLAISTHDLQRLAEHFAAQPRDVATSPFETWS